jgi:S1/P1 Nuclease
MRVLFAIWGFFGFLTLASNGPAEACAVDKVEQFQAELAAAKTDAEERLFALKFLLHFVGDLHQPLHSSDHHDRGGNSVKVIVDDFPHNARDELHGFWDTQLVDAIGTPPAALAAQLLAQITPVDASEWAAGSPEDWAMEAFMLAKADVYGTPPRWQGTEHSTWTQTTLTRRRWMCACNWAARAYALPTCSIRVLAPNQTTGTPASLPVGNPSVRFKTRLGGT